jgi:hypothetical protein
MRPKRLFFQAHPEALADKLAASARVNGLIASAVSVDPQSFWKNVRAALRLITMPSELVIYRTANILVRTVWPRGRSQRLKRLLAAAEAEG